MNQNKTPTCLRGNLIFNPFFWVDVLSQILEHGHPWLPTAAALAPLPVFFLAPGSQPPVHPPPQAGAHSQPRTVVQTRMRRNKGKKRRRRSWSGNGVGRGVARRGVFFWSKSICYKHIIPLPILCSLYLGPFLLSDYIQPNNTFYPRKGVSVPRHLFP